MGARIHVLVAGDAQTAAVVRSALAATCKCEIASSSDAALTSLARGEVDVVVADNRLGRMRGLDLFDAARTRHATVPFILLGDEDSGEAEADEARRHGIFDFLKKPVDGLAISAAVERAAVARQHRSEPTLEREAEGGNAPTIIGSSPRFLETLAAVNRVAQSSAPVLLVGETGTGKDLLACRIHMLGSRCHRPFVVVNAAALPATLLDSELFGHMAGSFTGATRARRGLISEADGGTVFLDEIADLPMELQGRLLRVIETGAIRSVGSDHERTVDVRFIAATHEPLAIAVAERRFREDLFYRLNILSLRVPPLRDRGDDIPALIVHFFRRARARTPQSPVNEITPEAMQRLVQAPWAGNVRELAAVIERLVVFGRQSRVEVEDLDALDHADARGVDTEPDGAVLTLRELSVRHVANVLARTHGDKASAAGILGIDVSTLYRWQRRNIG